MVRVLQLAQGDLLLQFVNDPVRPQDAKIIEPDDDGFLALARGELSGHRHVVPSADAEMYRSQVVNDPGSLVVKPQFGRSETYDTYVGHLRVVQTTTLSHEEHAPITLAPGTYVVRRQRLHAEPDPTQQRSFLLGD